MTPSWDDGDDSDDDGGSVVADFDTTDRTLTLGVRIAEIMGAKRTPRPGPAVPPIGVHGVPVDLVLTGGLPGGVATAGRSRPA